VRNEGNYYGVKRSASLHFGLYAKASGSSESGNVRRSVSSPNCVPWGSRMAALFTHRSRASAGNIEFFSTRQDKNKQTKKIHTRIHPHASRTFGPSFFLVPFNTGANRVCRIALDINDNN